MVLEYVIIIATRSWCTISQSNVCRYNGFHRLISIINSIFSLSFWFTPSSISQRLCKVLSHSSVENPPCSLLKVPESEDMKILWTLVTPTCLMSQSKWQRQVELCYLSVAGTLGTSCGCSMKLFAVGSAISLVCCQGRGKTVSSSSEPLHPCTHFLSAVGAFLSFFSCFYRGTPSLNFPSETLSTSFPWI